MSYSVITITLNSVQTIDNTIESVYSQSILPKQYIFVDGGSTDGTVDSILKWRVKLELLNIQVIIINQVNNNKNNAGIPSAWNLGIDASNSEFIFILNADDWYSSPLLASKVLNTFLNNNDIQAVAGITEMFDLENNKKINIIKNKPFWTFPFLNPICHPALFIRSNVYKEIGKFNTSYYISSDYDFVYRLHYKYKILINENIIVSRYHGGAASKNLKIARIETLEIGKKYSKTLLFPYFAFIMRLILKR
jgi:glycosyltransferase involved in cell wall biosynthesis